MPPDLDEGAERSNLAQKQDAAQSTQTNKSNSVDLDSPDFILKRSFVGELPKRVRVPLIVTTLAVLAGTIVVVHDGIGGELLWTVIVGLWLVIIFAWRTASQMFVHNERAWQASLPFPFDADSYKEALSRKTSRARCVVIVETSGTYEKTTNNIAIALKGDQVDKVLMRGAGAFEVHSKFFETVTDGEEYWAYSNLRLHQWFKAYAQNVLVPLHAAGLVRGVRVESKS